jgi:hypothetical protein
LIWPPALTSLEWSGAIFHHLLASDLIIEHPHLIRQRGDAKAKLFNALTLLELDFSEFLMQPLHISLPDLTLSAPTQSLWIDSHASWVESLTVIDTFILANTAWRSVINAILPSWKSGVPYWMGLPQPNRLEIDAHHQGPLSVVGAHQHQVHDPRHLLLHHPLDNVPPTIPVVRPARRW